MADVSERLRHTILTQAAERAPKSICLSDAARAVDAENWRQLVDATREIARQLARSGQVLVTQKGEVLDPDADWRGPVRIRAPLSRDMAP